MPISTSAVELTNPGPRRARIVALLATVAVAVLPTLATAGEVPVQARKLVTASRTVDRRPAPSHITTAELRRAPAASLPVGRGPVRGRLKAAWGDNSSRKQILADNAADAHVGEVLDHSRISGRYVLVSDLHWGRGRTSRPGRTSRAVTWDSAEDFRQPVAFVRLMERVAEIDRPTTLVIGGDWLELIKLVDADASPDAVKAAITVTLEGHAAEVRALVRASVDKGLRILYLRGNHDVQLSSTPYRRHLMTELARIGGLDAHGDKVLRGRMAWAGLGAPLGATGEALVVHGDIWDGVNNWRSPANPFDASGQLESNLGWHIVASLVRTLMSSGTRDHATLAEHAVDMVRRALFRGQLGPLIRTIFSERGDHDGPAADRAARVNDRVATRAWVERTGFDVKLDRAAGTPKGAAAWTKEIESIIARMPTPVLHTMRGGSLWHAVVGAARGLVAFLLRSASQRELVESFTALPGIRWVVWGHDHKTTRSNAHDVDKGAIGQRNSGSWTRQNGRWLLNAVVMSTDADGHVEMDGMFRTDAVTGMLAPLTPDDHVPEAALER